MDTEAPRFDRIIVFDADRASDSGRLEDAHAVLADAVGTEDVAEWVVATERARCLDALARPGSSLLITDVYGSDVRSGPRGARLMRAVAQHPQHGRRTRRVLVHHYTQTIPDWSVDWVHAVVASDRFDRAVFRAGLSRALREDTHGVPLNHDDDVGAQLRKFGQLPIEDADVPTAIRVFERAIGVTLPRSTGAETPAERDLLGRIMVSGAATDPRDARHRLTQAMSLSGYAERGYPSDRIAPEVAYLARRATAERPRQELTRQSTWLTPDEDRLAQGFLRGLDEVLRHDHGGLFARDAVHAALASEQYRRTRDVLGMDDADTVYAVWTLVDACSSEAARNLTRRNKDAHRAGPMLRRALRGLR